jgi:hypothetical protein
MKLEVRRARNNSKPAVYEGLTSFSKLSFWPSSLLSP